MPGVSLFDKEERKAFADKAVAILEAVESVDVGDAIDVIANTAVASAWIALAQL